MRHIKGLDGLRGIAALMVVLFHMDAFFGTAFSSTGQYTQATTAWQIYRRLIDGNFSVAIFFMLSGYVLLAAYEKTLSATYLTSSAIKRYFRLTPIVLASCVAAFLLQGMVGFHNVEAAQAIGGHQWLADEYREPLSFFGAIKCGLIGAYEGNLAYNGPLWTIRLELLGSFLLFGFAALFYTARHFPLYVATAICFMSALWGDDGLYLSLFLLGGMLVKYQRLRLPLIWIIPALVLATENQWTPEALFVSSHLPLPVSINALCHGAAAFLILAVTLKSDAFQRLLSIPPIAFLGRISFALYAFHLPIMMSIGAWVMVHGGAPRTAAVLAILATLAASLIVAFFASVTIDQWSQRISGAIAKALVRDDDKASPSYTKAAANQ
ncbi:acyltransferase family protein [Paraburkholderia silviterrae]|nr:acyltransferase [Paraburkholderia silviterrae]